MLLIVVSIEINGIISLVVVAVIIILILIIVASLFKFFRHRW